MHKKNYAVCIPSKNTKVYSGKTLLEGKHTYKERQITELQTGKEKKGGQDVLRSSVKDISW